MVAMPVTVGPLFKDTGWCVWLSRKSNRATATIDGIADVDTVFNKAESYMSVPLSYTDRTTYVIHYTETMRDTIEVKHRNIPFASDIECPVMMFYEVENLRYTTNALDSIQLVNPKITNEETINFNIYYRASSAE